MRPIGNVPVAKLLLDPLNPRIPEDLRERPQDELLRHLFDNDVLDELATSLVTNGYFDNEPLLVLPPDDDGKRVVVEGNRRLATLLVLLDTPTAQEAEAEFDLAEPPSADALVALESIPCFEVSSRQAVSAYLGYRHIGGLRQWPAEAKARFISAEVAEAERSGKSDPFYFVGRVIGSNARGVRSSYETLEILRFAHRELSFNTTPIRQRRFTVWGLLVGNNNIRDFIAYGRPRTLTEVKEAIASIDEGNLVFVLEDLLPRGKSGKAVLADSRSVSTYAEVVSDPRAREALARYDDLDLAASLLQEDGLTAQLDSIADRLETLLIEVSRLDIDAGAAAAAVRVRELAEAVESVVQTRTRA